MLHLARLLDYGCNVNAKDYDGSAAIHSAAEAGHAEAVALLLDRGADLHARNNYWDTALHLAAREGRLAVTKLLVWRGADLRARTKFDITPLAWATRSAEHEWESVVSFLESALSSGGATAPPLGSGAGGSEESEDEAYEPL